MISAMAVSELSETEVPRADQGLADIHYDVLKLRQALEI